MNKEKDIVTDILDRVETAVRDYLQSEQGFEQNFADAIAAQIRAQDQPVREHWHGARPYVPAAKRRDAKRQALDDVQRSGKVVEAATRHGISRATLYRLLKR